MAEWTHFINRWIVVLIQIGAVVTSLGLSWNLKDVIFDAGFSGSRVAAVVSRCVGVVMAFLLLAGAPGIVNSLQGLLRTQLAP
jgi:hypothetical protein